MILPVQRGSIDVGDVKQVVRVIRMKATTAASGGPWHLCTVVACTGMSIGHKGMIYGLKALAMTMADLYKSPLIVQNIKSDFLENKKYGKYDPKYYQVLPL